MHSILADCDRGDTTYTSAEMRQIDLSVRVMLFMRNMSIPNQFDRKKRQLNETNPRDTARF